MPAAPWTSGSTITAAISSSCTDEHPLEVGGVAGLGGSAFETAAVGRWSGRGRCRRPRPSRSCRRGRSRAGGRRRCGACAGRRSAAGTGRPSSGRSRPRSSRTPSRRRAESPAGASSTRRPASSAPPGWERPSMVECATLPSCSRHGRVDLRGAGGHGRCTRARRRRRCSAGPRRRSGRSPRLARSSAAPRRTNLAAA